MQAENERLRAELARITEQRDILKKSRGHPLRSVAERYAQIKSMSDKHSIKDMCATLSVSRRGYYQCKNTGQSPRAQQTNRLKSLIENEYEKSRQTMVVHGKHVPWAMEVRRWVTTGLPD